MLSGAQRVKFSYSDINIQKLNQINYLNNIER